LDVLLTVGIASSVKEVKAIRYNVLPTLCNKRVGEQTYQLSQI